VAGGDAGILEGGWLPVAARFLARIFYRKIEVVGLKKLPTDRPLVIVGNHGNALVDPMLLLGYLPIPSHFLAKHTLWKHPVVKHFVRLTEAIPVHRKQDPGADPTQNSSTFTACHQVLRLGGAITMFPEGVSHDGPQLKPMKTGAARIALEAEKLYGPLGVRILPVGLHFDARGKFRSAVMIRVGEPIDPLELGEHSGSKNRPESSSDLDPRNVRAVTERIDRGLRAVTLNFDSWQEARLVERAAEIYLREATSHAGNVSLAAGFGARKAVLESYQELRQSSPRAVETVIRTTREYNHLLEFFGLKDAQVASAYPLKRSIHFTMRSLLALFVWFPLAALGTVLNWIPYKTPGWIVRALKLESDLEATYRVLIAVVVFPLVWLVEAILAARFFGVWVGLTIGISASLVGYVALRFHETRKRFSEEVRAYLLLRNRAAIATELKTKRARICGEMEALVRQLEDQSESRLSQDRD
jgi:1-acyl-sn-glycerol-3-phosphate acyltransferase